MEMILLYCVRRKVRSDICLHVFNLIVVFCSQYKFALEALAVQDGIESQPKPLRHKASIRQCSSFTGLNDLTSNQIQDSAFKSSRGTKNNQLSVEGMPDTLNGKKGVIFILTHYHGNCCRIVASTLNCHQGDHELVVVLISHKDEFVKKIDFQGSQVDPAYYLPHYP